MCHGRSRGCLVFNCLLALVVAVGSAAGGPPDDDLVAGIIEDPTGPLARGLDSGRMTDLCNRVIPKLTKPGDRPKVSALRLAQGGAYTEGGNNDKALEALKQAVEADPTNVRAKLSHADLLWYCRKDHSAARRVWTEHPTDARALAVWARCSPDSVEARDKLAEQAVRLAGADPEAIAIAAECKGQFDISAGRYQDALAAFDRALANSGPAAWCVNLTGLHTRRGLVCLELGDASQALTDLGLAARSPITNRAVPRGVWLAHVHVGKFRVALGLADAYQAAYPDDPYGKVMRAASLIRLGRYAEAIDELDDCVPDAHTDTELAAAHHLSGDLAAAEEYLDAAIKKDITHLPALLAKVALPATGPTVAPRHGEPAQIYTKETADEFAKTVSRNPGSAPGLITRMLAHAAAKDYSQAAAAAGDALASRRVAPCYRDPLLKALAAYKAGQPFAAPPELLRIVYQPAVLFY